MVAFATPLGYNGENLKINYGVNMLDILRKKGVNKTILWVVATIIILSFGVFGTAYRLDNTVNSAGTMYGKSVSIKDFQKAYQDARDQAIILYGERFFKVSNMLNLEKEAWDRILLLQDAKKHGVKVTDADVAQFIASLPFFQRDGKFDQSLYLMIVKNRSIFDRTPHDFEEGIRSHLIIRNFLDEVAGSFVLSDEAFKQEFQKRNEKLTLSYILLDAATYAKGLSASDEEVTKFYTERKEQFKTAPSISVDYVQLKDKTAAFNLSAELTAQAKFEDLAKKYKTEIKTSNAFTHDQPILTFASNPEVIDALFGMKPGEYTKPQEVPDGWQIIRLKEKKDATIPAFEDIKDKVKETLLLQKGFEIAKTKADETLKAIKDTKSNDFKSVAASLGFKVEKTPPFSRGEYIAQMGLIREFQEEAAKLTMNNQLSSVIATSQGPAILYLENIEPVSDEQFKAEEENFRQMLTAQRHNERIMEYLTKLRLEANITSKIKYR